MSGPRKTRDTGSLFAGLTEDGPAEAKAAKQDRRPKVFGVAEIVDRIKGRLEQEGEVWVEGEVSNFRQPSSGHFYFTLKDDKAQLRAVLFRFHGQKLKFRLEDGLSVVCQGRLTVYEPRGDLQLLVSFAEPKGFGALQLAFEQLKEKLKAEGLFDEARKKPIPLLPRRIGVVTSLTGAALRDILNVLSRRNEKVSIVVAPARVQGEGAAAEIAAQLRALNELGGLDVIIAGRGGGSLEDLWSFNEEIVARAIAASRIPVISAVGHEIDFTIADFVADLRAPTPSAAAELVAASRTEMQGRLEALRRRLIGALREKTGLLRRRLSRASYDQLLARAVGVVSRFGQRLDDCRGRLERRMGERIQELRDRVERSGLEERIRAFPALTARLRDRVWNLARTAETASGARILKKRYTLDSLSGRLEAMNPRGVLSRGYSICRRAEDGALVKDAAEAPAGSRVSVELYRGGLTCEVLNPKPEA